MRNTHKLFFLFLLVACVTGCRTQRPFAGNDSGDPAVAQTDCGRAYEALRSGSFLLVPEEFIFPTRREPVRYASDSFLCMKDGRATLYVPWDLFRGSSFEHWGTDERPAHITESRPAKNGGARFRIVLRGAESREYRIEITLFKNTDRCSAVLYDQSKGVHVANIRGTIRPADE